MNFELSRYSISCVPKKAADNEVLRTQMIPYHKLKLDSEDYNYEQVK